MTTPALKRGAAGRSRCLYNRGIVVSTTERRNIGCGATTRRGASMRDWLFLAVAAGVAIYFVYEPEKFEAFVSWLQSLFN